MEKEEIMKRFSGFTCGNRLIMLIQRAKEGGSSKTDRGATKKISTNEIEFEEILAGFLKEKNESELNLRIYSTVNSRSMEAAIREFKRTQLEADYYDLPSKYSFYVDVDNRFKSCFAKPCSKEESRFLFDIDDGINPDEVREEIKNV